MGLFNFGKKNKGYRCTQYALFNNTGFNAEEFINSFEKDRGIKLEIEVHNKNNIISLRFKIENAEFVWNVIILLDCSGEYRAEINDEAAGKTIESVK